VFAGVGNGNALGSVRESATRFADLLTRRELAQ
jgi:hypothetical protein